MIWCAIVSTARQVAGYRTVFRLAQDVLQGNVREQPCGFYQARERQESTG